MKREEGWCAEIEGSDTKEGMKELGGLEKGRKGRGTKKWREGRKGYKEKGERGTRCRGMILKGKGMQGKEGTDTGKGSREERK